MLSEKYLSQTIECMAAVWASDSKTRSISEYFPLARRVCETALKSCLSIIMVDIVCDRVVGFDVNLDLMELLELAVGEPDEPNLGANGVSQFGASAAVSLGRYDFLNEIIAFYTQQRKLTPRKGDALFHNYVGMTPGYRNEGAWHICLALALEIARSNNFCTVVAVTTSSIADQKACEQLGFKKIGDLEYATSKYVPIQKNLAKQSSVYLYDIRKAKL